jgi:hypothetical protein
MLKIDFDLFQLHQKEDDFDPRSWILASGNRLKIEVNDLLRDLLKQYRKQDIINKIATELNINIKLLVNMNPSEYSKEIEDRLAESKFTKTQLAELTGTSGGHLNKLLNNEHFPFCSKMGKMQKHLGQSSILDINCHKNDYCLKKLNLIWNSFTSNEIPLCVLGKLFNLWKNELQITEADFRLKKREIFSSIEYLRMNHHVSKPVKANLFLDETLAKIIGAFCADGNFYPPDMFRWEEEHKSNLDALSKWIYDYFGIQANVVETKRDRKSWFYRFRSKVFARYMELFFEFKAGSKTYSVRAPEIIQTASQDIQRAFAMGALMFDGSVNYDGTISFTVASKDFRDDVTEIILRDKIPLTLSENYNIKGHWSFVSSRSLSEFSRRKLLWYFEERTIKWVRLKEFLDGFNFKVYSLYEAKRLLSNRFYHFKNPTIVELFTYFDKHEEFDVYDLMKKFNSKRKSINDRLAILESAKVVNSMCRKRRIYNFNPEISEWRLPSQESF